MFAQWTHMKRCANDIDFVKETFCGCHTFMNDFFTLRLKYITHNVDIKKILGIEPTSVAFFLEFQFVKLSEEKKNA
jgi:hypothetical protein